jgi:hypothetical protein
MCLCMYDPITFKLRLSLTCFNPSTAKSYHRTISRLYGIDQKNLQYFLEMTFKQQQIQSTETPLFPLKIGKPHVMPSIDINAVLTV